MFCNKCGKQIEDDISFCPYCGNKVTISSETNQSNKSKIIIICCIFVVLIGVSIALIFLFKNQDESLKQDNKVENPQPTDESNIKETEKAPTVDEKTEDSTTATVDKVGDWKQAFVDYINPEELYIQTAGESFTELAKEEYAIFPAYTLWDLNQDGIPEVICAYVQNDISTGVLLSYNKFTDSVMKYDCTGREFSYSGKELKAYYWSTMSNVSFVYSLNEDGSLKEEFFYFIKRDEGGRESYWRGYTKGQEKLSEEISENEYQQYNLKYSQSLELNLTYGELIQEIKNYGNN